MLANVLTMCDHSGKPLAEVSCYYLGDGSNASSLLVTGALLGFDLRICAPDRPLPSPSVEATVKGSCRRVRRQADRHADIANIGQSPGPGRDAVVAGDRQDIAQAQLGDFGTEGAVATVSLISRRPHGRYPAATAPVIISRASCG